MFRDWLRVFRSQTASASFIVMLVCFLVAGGQLFTLWGLAILVFAVLLHWFTFGHNSLLDTALGYDKKDKYKKHHPLVSGKIKLEKAHNIIHTGLFVLAVIGLLLIYFSPGNQFLAALFFVIYLASGHWYNDGFSKTSIFSAIPISICFTSLGLFSYFLFASEFSVIMIYLILYIFFNIYFQISWEGDLKEIGSSENNMLKRLGVKLTMRKSYLHVGKAAIYAWTIKIINLIIGLIILSSILFSFSEFIFYLPTIIVAAFFFGMAISECHLLTCSQKWDRNKILRYCAIEEIATIYLMIAVLIPVIGYLEGITLMILGIVYFIAMNKLNWSTTLRPQV